MPQGWENAPYGTSSASSIPWHELNGLAAVPKLHQSARSFFCPDTSYGQNQYWRA
jgi:hypothetical protein